MARAPYGFFNCLRSRAFHNRLADSSFCFSSRPQERGPHRKRPLRLHSQSALLWIVDTGIGICHRLAQLVGGVDRFRHFFRNLPSRDPLGRSIPAREISRIRGVRAPRAAPGPSPPRVQKQRGIGYLASLLEAPRIQCCAGRFIDDRSPCNQVRLAEAMTTWWTVALGILALYVTVVIGPFCLAEDKPGAPTISSSPTSRIIPPSPSYQFANGQKLVYSVEWHLLNAGAATMIIQRSPSGEHLISTADSVGFPNKIFPVHDTFEADVDGKSFCTTVITQHAEEGPRRLDRKVLLDYAHAKSKVDEKDLKTSKLKHAEFDIPACVTDVVSGFFYVASLNLAPGFSHTFPVNDHGKTSDVRIDVEVRERIKIQSGEFQTVRVKAVPLAGGMLGKGVLWVWFTDDAKHMPVQMKSKLGFATLLFRLQKTETQSAAK